MPIIKAIKIGSTYVIVTGDSEEEVTIEETVTTVGSGGGIGFGNNGFGRGDMQRPDGQMLQNRP